MAVGLVLAVAYHVASMRVQLWVSRRKSALVPAVVILGFLARLAGLCLILVVLALWTPLNVLALCVAFVVVFTLLTGFSLYRVVAKRHTTPPGADAGGVH